MVSGFGSPLDKHVAIAIILSEDSEHLTRADNTLGALSCFVSWVRRCACLRVCLFLSPLASKNGISESGSSEYYYLQTGNQGASQSKLEREVRIIDHDVQGDNVLFMETYFFLSSCDAFLAKHRGPRAYRCRYWNGNLLSIHSTVFTPEARRAGTFGLDLLILRCC